jgi:hypothetical protein
MGSHPRATAWAHPLGDREPPGAGHTLNLPILAILQNHLQTLSHRMSLEDSPR